MHTNISEAPSPRFLLLKKLAPWILALIVAVVIGLPSAYFHFHDPSYRGIELFGADAEEGYLAQIRDVYDGHVLLGNPYLADGKDQPYVQQPLSPLVMAGFAKLTRLSVARFNLIAKFLFPFFLTLLVYVFFYQLFRRRGLSLFLTLVVMMAPASLSFIDPREIIKFLMHGRFLDAEFQFLSYSRPINPQISAFFFYGYLASVWSFLFGSRKTWQGILAAVLLGLSFYVYFFTFSLLFAFTGCLALWLLWKKDRPRFVGLCLIVATALLFGIPYFLNAWHVMHSPYYAETIHRLGMADTHAFIFSRIWWLAIILLLLLYRARDPLKVFFLSFLGAAFLVTNQQVLTGHTAPIPSHYHWYYIAPIGTCLLFFLVWHAVERWRRKQLPVFLLGLAALFVLTAGIVFQRQSYAAQHDTFVERQRYADALAWLDRVSLDERVVFSNAVRVVPLVPVYTHHNNYYHTMEGDFLVPESVLRDGWFFQLFLDGQTATSIHAYVYANRDEIAERLYSQKYRALNGCYGCMPDALLDAFIADYLQFLQKGFLAALRTRQVDFVVWDKVRDPQWRLDRFFQDVVYDKDEIRIFDAHPPSP